MNSKKAAVLVLGAVLVLSGCSSKSSSGSSSSGSSGGGYQRHPEPWDSPSANSVGGAGPVVSADAAPLHSSDFQLVPGIPCGIDLQPPGRGLIAGHGLVSANAFATCLPDGQPQSSHIVVQIEYETTLGGWIPEDPPSVSDDIPPIFPDSIHLNTAIHCVPGNYRIFVSVSGIDGSGKPYNHSRNGDQVTYSGKQCVAS